MNEEMRKAFAGITGSLSGIPTAIAVPIPPPSVHLPDSAVNPAKWTYTRLSEYIKSFEKALDGEHEIGVRLVSFGQSITFHIQDMGYYGPDIITFSGVDESGQAVRLIQHTSQLSVLLMAVKKQAETPRRIGFILDQREAGESKKG